jgi:hypothetical protein
MKNNFHKISYLQYPLMVIAIFYALRPFYYLFNKSENFFELYLKDVNSFLVFMGLAISFSSLQDTSKTQNNYSKKIWENPKKGKITINLMIAMIILFLTLGMIGFFSTNDSKLKELSFGLLVFGIGYLGLLKSAMEMFENHRLDQK